MAHAKKSITLDAELVQEIEELVGPRGFSAFRNESAKIRLLVERGRAAVRDYEVAHGTVPDDNLAAVSSSASTTTPRRQGTTPAASPPQYTSGTNVWSVIGGRT